MLKVCRMCLPTFAKPVLYEVPTYLAGCQIGTLNRKTKRKKAMGYRTYIGSMPKREYNKIKSMSREQLIEHYKLEVEEDENYLELKVTVA